MSWFSKLINALKTTKADSTHHLFTQHAVLAAREIADLIYYLPSAFLSPLSPVRVFSSFSFHVQIHVYSKYADKAYTDHRNPHMGREQYQHSDTRRAYH